MCGRWRREQPGPLLTRPPDHVDNESEGFRTLKFNLIGSETEIHRIREELRSVVESRRIRATPSSSPVRIRWILIRAHLGSWFGSFEKDSYPVHLTPNRKYKQTGEKRSGQASRTGLASWLTPPSLRHRDFWPPRNFSKQDAPFRKISY